MKNSPTDLALNPLIADQTADTLYAVACVLEVLQAVSPDALTNRGRLGSHLVMEAAQRALLFETNRPPSYD